MIGKTEAQLTAEGVSYEVRAGAACSRFLFSQKDGLARNTRTRDRGDVHQQMCDYCLSTWG